MFRAGLSLGVSPSPAPGWDISSLNLAEAMRRAQVLDWGLQEQLWPHLEALRPRPSVYIPEFIAANQSVRADNLILGTRAQQVRPHPKPFIPCHLLLPDIAHHPTPVPVLLSMCLLAPILRFQTSPGRGACTTSFPPCPAGADP